MAELVERPLEGYAGLLDPSRRRAEVLRSRNGGQRDPRTDGGEQLLGSEATCDGGIRGKNPSACRVATEVSWLEEVPGVEEKLLRWLAGVLVRRGGDSMTAQGPFRGRARWRRSRVFGLRKEGEMRAQGLGAV